MVVRIGLCRSRAPSHCRSRSRFRHSLCGADQVSRSGSTGFNSGFLEAMGASAPPKAARPQHGLRTAPMPHRSLAPTASRAVRTHAPRLRWRMLRATYHLELERVEREPSSALLRHTACAPADANPHGVHATRFYVVEATTTAMCALARPHRAAHPWQRR